MSTASNYNFSDAAIGQLLIAEARRRLIDESLPRIRKCLGELTEDEIWDRPNENVVSIGNLVLHLCGNVRQWIVTGLGGAEDHRDRDSEFADRGPISRHDLITRLENTLREALDVIEHTDPATLAQPRRVQGYDETGVSILVHVIEHFSYHTGQISLAVKTRKNLDLGYYAGKNLNAID